MIQFFAGVLLLAIVFLGLRLFSRSEPKALAKLFRQLLAVVAFVVAILLVFTSRYAVLSLPVGLVALSLLLGWRWPCLLYTSPSPRDRTRSRMPSSA